MRKGWEKGCIADIEEMHSDEPHEHNTYCEVIAIAMAEDRQAEIMAHTQDESR